MTENLLPRFILSIDLGPVNTSIYIQERQQRMLLWELWNWGIPIKAFASSYTELSRRVEHQFREKVWPILPAVAGDTVVCLLEHQPQQFSYRNIVLEVMIAQYLRYCNQPFTVVVEHYSSKHKLTSLPPRLLAIEPQKENKRNRTSAAKKSTKKKRKSSHEENKAKAIAICGALLEEWKVQNPVNMSAIHNWFLNLKKKDDVSDSLLQCQSYIWQCQSQTAKSKNQQCQLLPL